MKINWNIILKVPSYWLQVTLLWNMIFAYFLASQFLTLYAFKEKSIDPVVSGKIENKYPKKDNKI